jgi:hypothetical protein
MSTTRYITVNQGPLSSGYGDVSYITSGVTISGGIDMLAGGGGYQFITIYGIVFGHIDDNAGASSGFDRMLIGSTGSVNAVGSAIELSGGGDLITNAGMISSLNADGIFLAAAVSA